MASTAEELTAQAQGMQDSMAFFKVETHVRRTQKQSTPKYGVPKKSDSKQTVGQASHNVGDNEKGISLDMGKTLDGASDNDFERY